MTATLSRARSMPIARKRKRYGRGKWTLAHLFLAALAIYFLIPVWWLFVASSKTTKGLFGGSAGPMLFDKDFALFSNIGNLFTFNDGVFIRWIANSAYYAVAGGVVATAIAVLAGYGFAKYRFPGRNFMFAALLGSVMVPLTALVIPTFILFSNAGLVNTPWAVILPSFLSPFGVYLMRVYIADAVPTELMDAARIDGAGEFRTFTSVALPLMRPAIVTVLLLSVVANWNNYFLPLAMLTSNKLFPITVGLGQWLSIATGNDGGGPEFWSMIVVGSFVSIVPLVIAFLTMQKYWQGGLSIGSLK
jgi:multiple sugar transport system permease protein